MLWVLLCCASQRPSVIPAQFLSEEIVSSLDVFPLVANLTAQPMPTDRPFDGVNMVCMCVCVCVGGGWGWIRACA
jgi:hypothetical protein